LILDEGYKGGEFRMASSFSKSKVRD